MEDNKIKKIYSILIETFPESKVPKNIENLQMGDLEGWDSLGNFNLLLSIEEVFSIRFTMEQMSKVKSINEIIKVIENDNT